MYMYFQDIIFTLQQYWAEKGCAILQPYDIEMGAGTSHPATTLRALSEPKWNVAYVQPSRRPGDGRYGNNPNRAQYFHQYQVILKPSPDNIQELCLESLYKIGLNKNKHDLRFVEDDWENPTLGAWGLGWEVWCDGMEVFQFTYMQQLGGIECTPVVGELTYGLERLASFIQGVDSTWDIKWNKEGLTYSDIFMQFEKEHSAYNLEYADIDILKKQFSDVKELAMQLLKQKLVYPAYDQCLKASHMFNLLESRGAISVTERASYIAQIRDIAKKCCELHLENSRGS